MLTFIAVDLTPSTSNLTKDHTEEETGTSISFDNKARKKA